VTGGFAAADVARTRFVDDYDGVIERSETFLGRVCDVLLLRAKKGRDPAFPVLRVWIDREEGRTRKVVFLLSSGKTAREATFDEWGELGGVATVTRMTIVDALRPEPHPTHCSISEALEIIRQAAPGEAWLTHLGHENDHTELGLGLPTGVHVAWDGLEIPL
jgi:hypothetical protein